MGFYTRAFRSMVSLALENAEMGSFRTELAPESEEEEQEPEEAASPVLVGKRSERARFGPTPELAPAAPALTASQASASCSTCNVHALLADVQAIVGGAARICPTEGLAWDVVGGFGAAKDKVEEAITELPKLRGLGAPQEAEQLSALLPGLAAKLAHIPDCQALQEVAGLANQASGIAFSAQRQVRRKRETVKQQVLTLAKAVKDGQKTREQALSELRASVGAAMP